MVTRLVELRKPDIARLVHPRVIQFECQSPIKIVAHTDIHAPDIDTVLVPIEGTLLVLVGIVDGGDALVEDITVAHEGEVIDTVQNATVPDAVLSLYGDVEVVTLLRLKVRIADDPIAHITHVEVHINLLECRCTKATGIVGAEGHPRKFIHYGKTSCKRLL